MVNSFSTMSLAPLNKSLTATSLIWTHAMWPRQFPESARLNVRVLRDWIIGLLDWIIALSNLLITYSLPPDTYELMIPVNKLVNSKSSIDWLIAAILEYSLSWDYMLWLRRPVAQSSNICRPVGCRPVGLSPRWPYALYLIVFLFDSITCTCVTCTQ